MPNFAPLSRRRFGALLGLSALIVALPVLRGKANALSGDAAWSAVEAGAAGNRALALTGYLKRISDSHYNFSRARHHCDFCYTGHPASVMQVTSAAPLQEGSTVTLRGILKSGRFICG